LGFAEKDQVRGEDSFVTFEEILQNAKELQVRDSLPIRASTNKLLN
jgi:DNA repair exonuclease SbcCD nuclease subunit